MKQDYFGVPYGNRTRVAAVTGIQRKPECSRASSNLQHYVRFVVVLQWQITDEDPDDKDEFAGISLTLIAKGIPAIKEEFHSKKTALPVSRTFVLSVGPIVSAEPFSVYAKLDATVTTDGPMNPLGDSASIIRIDVVKIILESTPCADSSKTPPKETPPVTPRRETESGGR